MSRAHSPSFPSLHLRHSSFSNPSLALPTSQLILQPFRSFTYVTAHSPTLLSLLLRHRIFTYVTWRAAHGGLNEYCNGYGNECHGTASTHRSSDQGDNYLTVRLISKYGSTKSISGENHSCNLYIQYFNVFNLKSKLRVGGGIALDSFEDIVRIFKERALSSRDC